MLRLRVATFCLVALALQAQSVKPVDFNRDVRPILSDTCYTCHGPDDGTRKANLRLDLREDAMKVIVPGDPKASKLILRAAHEKRALRMPPPGAGQPLTDSQIELLRRWVAEGARWQTHWAYEPVQRPDPPQNRFKTWPRSDMDRFVLAKLEAEGLKPSPEAPKATLLRRVSLDLTGLPPTPEEVEAFLKDKTPDAYEKRVDALLASPRYGERMAMMWLDLARYADTHGYHIDSHRVMWPWRDWVISAFNRNLPFDQFTVWQLAGDLLPGATREQKLASGFNRNHMINYEGGAIAEEYQTEYVVDRVDATATTWMATTMACARCHDHKYDPIKQREFYQFFAFFNTISEKGLDGRDGNAEPFLALPTSDQEARLKEIEAGIEKRDAILVEKEVESRQTQWEQDWRYRISENPTQNLEAWYELDGSTSDLSGNHRHARLRTGDLTYSNRGADFDGETLVDWGNALDFSKPFTVAFSFRTSRKEPQPVLTRLDDAKTRRGFEVAVEDPEILPHLQRGLKLAVRLSNTFPSDAVSIRTKQPAIIQNTIYHVTITSDGTNRAAGWKCFLNGKPIEMEVEADSLTAVPALRASLETGNKAFGFPWRGRLDDLRVYARRLSPQEVGQIAIHYPMETLAGLPGKRTKEQAAKLRDYFLSTAAPDPYRTAYNEKRELEKSRDALEETIPNVMVMKESDKPRETFVLNRGDYTQKRDKVTPATPAVFPALPAGETPNRLTLAKWLTSADHPLTARVAVNRFWQLYFGVGLVKTSEDFGSQGEPPSHPELLDWLASEFVRSGWDVKALQRLIVTSATYRQSSKVPPELKEKDPENRLLARGPRFRIPAELVRDNALAVSGLLNSEIGGPSVLPYQPAGVWEELAYGDIFSAQTYVQDHGDKLYRRGMYTFWKRTAPPATLTTFDAPDREKCVGRRAVTNTPLQALALLNDPTFIEASRAMAQRVLKDNPKASDDSKLRSAFVLATARTPQPQELKVLRSALRQNRTTYSKDPEAAAELLKTGETAVDPALKAPELAAWTNVCTVLLNLDETITKE